MRALKCITGHVIYNLAYTYKFQLKTTFLSLYRGPESGAGGGSGGFGQHYSGNKPPLISGGTVNDNSGGKGPIFL